MNRLTYDVQLVTSRYHKNYTAHCFAFKLYKDFGYDFYVLHQQIFHYKEPYWLDENENEIIEYYPYIEDYAMDSWEYEDAIGFWNTFEPAKEYMKENEQQILGELHEDPNTRLLLLLNVEI